MSRENTGVSKTIVTFLTVVDSNKKMIPHFFYKHREKFSAYTTRKFLVPCVNQAVLFNQNGSPNQPFRKLQKFPQNKLAVFRPADLCPLRPGLKLNNYINTFKAAIEKRWAKMFMVPRYAAFQNRVENVRENNE